MRNEVNKQDAVPIVIGRAGKSRKLFRCGVDENNPYQSIDRRFIPLKEGQEAGYFPEYHKPPQSVGIRKLVIQKSWRYDYESLNFKPDTIWNQ